MPILVNSRSQTRAGSQDPVPHASDVCLWQVADLPHSFSLTSEDRSGKLIRFVVSRIAGQTFEFRRTCPFAILN